MGYVLENAFNKTLSLLYVKNNRYIKINYQFPYHKKYFNINFVFNQIT